MEENVVSAEWLKRTELFNTLEESQLNLLLTRAAVNSFSEGEMIFRQGENADHLYVLIKGAVDLSVKAREEIGFMTSRIEKEGEVFGTPSLLEPYVYNVAAKCLEPAQVLTIEAPFLRRRMEEDPKMGMEIMKKLASIYFSRLNELRSGVSNLLKVLKVKSP
jgi:CRP-like cAMP-binding protein